VLPRSSTANKAEAEQRWAQTQTIEQHQLQELIALRTECHANFPARKFWRDTARWQKRNNPGRIQLRLKVQTNPLKLLI
jgi:hypothetical protein